MSQSRYITMLGDPVSEPLSKTFYKSADVHVGLAATVGGYVLQQELFAPGSRYPDPVDIGMFSLIDMALWRFFEKRQATRLSIENKCIDTQPDQNTPPTTGKYGLAANSMKKYYIGMGVLFGLMDGIEIVAHAVTTGNVGPYIINKRLLQL